MNRRIGLFIQDIKVGMDVYYYPYLSKFENDEPIKTKIASEPWQLGHGEIVCKVDGISGGVCISHLSTEYYRKRWFPAKKIKSRERYTQWLESGCYISFGEWLKGGYYMTDAEREDAECRRFARKHDL